MTDFIDAQIRRATFADEAQLLDLLKPLQSPSFHWPPDNFLSEFQACETWVLAAEGRLEAFICVRDAVDAWELSVLATRELAQGKGHMSILLKAVIERYNRERQLWLEVHENNTSARKLYEKCGFESQGQRPSYYRDGAAAILYTRAVGKF
jgi:ribosomal-protein-alanine N-acetyltransferase